MVSDDRQLQNLHSRLDKLEAQHQTLTTQPRGKGVVSVIVTSVVSTLVTLIIVFGLNVTALRAQIPQGIQAIPLKGTDRFRVSIHPVGGHLLLSVFDDQKGEFLPILQFKGDLLHGPSALGAPQFWSKLFLQGPGNSPTYEFIEFRAGRDNSKSGDFPQGSPGIGGFLYRTAGEQLVEWAENWKGLAFATTSRSQPSEGTLGTVRLSIGPSGDDTLDDVPITVSDAWLTFDSGTVNHEQQPNISVTHTNSMLVIAGGTSDRNAASLSLHGMKHPELPGTAVLATPNAVGEHKVDSISRMTVSSGPDAFINLEAPVQASAGLVVSAGQYLRLAGLNNGAPPAGDCDSDDERGRVTISVKPNQLFVCQGAAGGWDHLFLIGIREIERSLPDPSLSALPLFIGD